MHVTMRIRRASTRVIHTLLAASVGCALLSLAAERASASIVFDIPEVTVYGDGVSPTMGVFQVELLLTGDDLTSPPLADTLNIAIYVDDSRVILGPAEPATEDPLFVGGNFSDEVPEEEPKLQRSWAYHDVEPSVETFDGAGLVTVHFTVETGVFGTFPLDFDPVFLNQLAEGGIILPIELQDGSITVRPIPESAWTTAILMLIAGACAIRAGRTRSHENLA